MSSLLEQVRARRKFRRSRLPRQREPRAIQLAYFSAIRKVLASAKSRVDWQLVPLLPVLAARAAERRGDSVERIDAMDPGKRVNKLLDRISESFYREWDPSRLTAIARKYGEAVSDFQREELRKQIQARLGIDPMISNAGLAQRIKDFTAENVALIKSIPQQFFDQVEQQVINGIRTGARSTDVAKQIEERFEVSESRAKLIARDQTLKFHGELNGARQQALGVEKYIWRTVSDERVRDAHSEFDGNTYSWDDPPGDGSPAEGTHPGTAINCRCYADPVLEDFTEGG